MVRWVKIRIRMTERTESQSHGFMFEDLLKRALGIPGTSGYTDVHDWTEEGRTTSCKSYAIKGKAVCFSNPLRILDYPDTCLHTCIVAGYEQSTPTQKTLKRITDFRLDKKVLFGNVTREDMIAYEALIKSVPHHTHPRDNVDLHRSLETLTDELNKKSGAFHFNRKIDHKTQRRLQCSIPNFTSFIASNPELVLSDSSDTLRGVRIEQTMIDSPPRTRVKKLNGLRLG